MQGHDSLGRIGVLKDTMKDTVTQAVGTVIGSTALTITGLAQPVTLAILVGVGLLLALSGHHPKRATPSSEATDVEGSP